MGPPAIRGLVVDDLASSGGDPKSGAIPRVLAGLRHWLGARRAVVDRNADNASPPPVA